MVCIVFSRSFARSHPAKYSLYNNTINILTIVFFFSLLLSFLLVGDTVKRLLIMPGPLTNFFFKILFSDTSVGRCHIQGYPHQTHWGHTPGGCGDDGLLQIHNITLNNLTAYIRVSSLTIPSHEISHENSRRSSRHRSFQVV